MDAKPRSLKDVFEVQCRYLVPLYQRPYVWKRVEQWEPLWEDIQALAERYLRNDSSRPHFMGAVVLEQLSNATGTLDIRQIIDGQQRLTTLQIIIEAACDVCDVLGQVASSNARDLRLLTRNIQRDSNPDETFKVWPTNVDREHFRRVMMAGSPEELQQYYDGESTAVVGYAIANGYLFFHQKITEWLKADSEELLKKKLDSLQNALYRGLMVVIIDLDEKDDAQMIFETLNARGTPLLASDLVKNYLLHRAEECGYDLDKLYYQHWEIFDSNHFWREDVRTGRFNRPHIEVFLQHYITLLTRDEVLIASLFNTFRQYIKAHKDIDPAIYLAELNRYGKIYHQFYHYPPETPEGLFFRRVQALDTTTIFPLLLTVFDKLGGPEYAQQRQFILTDLESFLVRRMICEFSTKNYNKFFLEAVKRLKDAEPGQFASILRTHLISQTIDISRWPDDSEFQEAWQKLEAYKRLKPQIRLRMVLEALELQRRTNNRTEDLRLPKKKLSIEHILPRGWAKENWPIAEDTQEAKDARNMLLHTLGNLTLVTGSLNSTLSNDPWSKKSKTLQKYSILLLNSDLQVVEEWNEAAIKNRSKELFTLAKKIWPFPIE
jgi:hypothetical protein